MDFMDCIMVSKIKGSNQMKNEIVEKAKEMLNFFTCCKFCSIIYKGHVDPSIIVKSITYLLQMPLPLITSGLIPKILTNELIDKLYLLM
ncbi:hypothetical protein NQ317_002237 [Molorchus minor]|uniref:Uncharacterized protein n=1 Tax=Molorchus minor TaxID=1323400 RepID=A0ABQ9JDA6_9CUCU|nr:hypothetical protein NQ317_002237 [Molorchus minor]